VQQDKICIECGCWVPKEAGKARICSDECRDDRKKRGRASLDGRFAALQRVLDAEGCPQNTWNEKLRSKNYYEQIILSGRCVFCDAEVSEVSGSGHLMGRIDHTKPHTAANCIGGPVCGLCNFLAGKDRLSVDELFILRPGLITIRTRRELMKSTKRPKYFRQ
jgi:hypothetical protein